MPCLCSLTLSFPNFNFQNLSPMDVNSSNRSSCDTCEYTLKLYLTYCTNWLNRGNQPAQELIIGYYTEHSKELEEELCRRMSDYEDQAQAHAQTKNHDAICSDVCVAMFKDEIRHQVGRLRAIQLTIAELYKAYGMRRLKFLCVAGPKENVNCTAKEAYACEILQALQDESSKIRTAGFVLDNFLQCAHDYTSCWKYNSAI